MEPGSQEALTATYSPDTWRIYEDLDVSLDPAGPDELLELAGAHLTAGQAVLDAGCRDAAHLIALCRRHDVHGIGIDPATAHVQQAKAAVADAGLGDRITLWQGLLEDTPVEPDSIDLLWCRDVVPQVGDLTGFVAAAARALRPQGSMLVFTVLDHGLTVPDRRLLAHHRGVVPDNLDPGRLSRAYDDAGLEVAETHEIGTRWREYAEEQDGTVSRKLLQLARLRRRRGELTDRHGIASVAHVEANLHWELWQFLGLTLPVVHVLRRRR